MLASLLRAALMFSAILLPSTLGGLAFGGLLGAFNHAAAQQPHAVFSVTNNADSGAGSLRQAILDANSAPGPDLIAVSAAGTVALLSPLPTISGALTIQGPGAHQFRVDGQQQFRVFDIAAVPVTIADLTIQHGAPGDPSDNGAGIRSSGALTLTNVAVLSNTVPHHGAGVNVNGDLTLNGGEFRNNHTATGVGGALHVSGHSLISGVHFVDNSSRNHGGAAYLLGSAAIHDTLFQGNQCTAYQCDGGALFSFSTTEVSASQFLHNVAQDHGGAMEAPGTITITGSLFAHNQSVYSSGGALAVSGQIAVTASQFISNTARNNGAAIEATAALDRNPFLLSDVHFQDNLSTLGAGGALKVSGPFLITRSTFLHNRALEGGAIAHIFLGDGDIANTLFVANEAAGAAMHLQSAGAVRVRHATIVGAAPSGAAISVLTGTVAITNTIVASHTVAIARIDGHVSQDYNLFSANGSDLDGQISGGAHSFNASPQFVAETAGDYHLQPASPAVDAGANAHIYEDFDGDARPYNHGFDIGFDELTIGDVPPTPTPTLTPTSSPTPSLTATPPAPTPPPPTPLPSATPIAPGHRLYLPVITGRHP